MEVQAKDIDLLDELCFSRSFKELMEAGFSEDELIKRLRKLVELDLVQIYYPNRDDEYAFELKKYEDFYSDYYYLATKKGLKKLFG